MTWNKTWSVNRERVARNTFELTSLRGHATVTKKSDGWQVAGETTLPRYDGRPVFVGGYNTDEPTPVLNGVKINWAREVTTSAVEYVKENEGRVGTFRLTGIWTLKEANGQAWVRVALIPAVCPFQIALAHDTAEGLRDWNKLKDNLNDFIEEMCNADYKKALADRKQRQPELDLLDLLDRREQEELHYFYYKIVVCEWMPKFGRTNATRTEENEEVLYDESENDSEF